VRLSTGDEAPLLDDARLIQTELRGHQAAANSTPAAITLKTKIANAEQKKVHPAEAGRVIGNGEVEANAVSLRVHGKGNLGAKPRNEAIASLFASVKERRG
jgi:threonyl-tRNA synthetase